MQTRSSKAQRAGRVGRISIPRRRERASPSTWPQPSVPGEATARVECGPQQVEKGCFSGPGPNRFSSQKETGPISLGAPRTDIQLGRRTAANATILVAANLSRAFVRLSAGC
jgi:hypothetical protein